MDIKLIKDSALFHGMSEKDISAALAGLNAIESRYKRGSTVMHAKSITNMMGLILEGSITIENNDVWGNKIILNMVGKNQVFAETYAILKDKPLLVNVIANEDCHILFLHISMLNSLISKTNPWSVKLTANLLTIIAHKNLALSGRSFHTSPKTIRVRVMLYLNSMYIQKKSAYFHIPFDRQQLADYLNVERTALSKELHKMQNDGLIEFRKNYFAIKSKEVLEVQ